ncbi:MAG: hypothetical protein AB4060_00700 [Crocosphaera sp.]
MGQYCSVKENCLLRQAGAAEGENGTSSSAPSAPDPSSASLNWSVSSLTEQYWGVGSIGCGNASSTINQLKNILSTEA